MKLNHTLKFYKYRLKKKAEVLNHRRPVQDYLLPMINGHKEVAILDVGCGPYPTVGTEHRAVRIKLTACDLFADEYTELMQEQDIEPLVRIKKQDMHNLSYDENAFDIVYCENALDHTDNAIKALAELCRVSKKWVVLKHFPNVGERNNYKGLHHWNLSFDGTLWNKAHKIHLDGFKTKKLGRMVFSTCRI